MARISKITLQQQPSFHALTIRKTINFMDEFSTLADYAFKKIAKYLEAVNMLPGGAPIICFHNMDLEHLDVEIGFPVAAPVSGKDDMMATTVPTQKVVTAVDVGPYEQHDATLNELFAWAQSNGLELSGEVYYQYLNDEEQPESEYLTVMSVPVK